MVDIMCVFCICNDAGLCSFVANEPTLKYTGSWYVGFLKYKFYCKLVQSEHFGSTARRGNIIADTAILQFGLNFEFNCGIKVCVTFKCYLFVLIDNILKLIINNWVPDCQASNFYILPSNCYIALSNLTVRLHPVGENCIWGCYSIKITSNPPPLLSHFLIDSPYPLHLVPRFYSDHDNQHSWWIFVLSQLPAPIITMEAPSVVQTPFFKMRLTDG